jgi:hypothetical protein
VKIQPQWVATPEKQTNNIINKTEEFGFNFRNKRWA